MGGRWRLAACLAVVLAAHAGLMAVLLRTPASGVRHPPPHRTATMRLQVLGPVSEPQVAPPEFRVPSTDSAEAPLRASPAPSYPGPAAVPHPLAAATRSALAPEPVASLPPSSRGPTIAPAHDFLSPIQVDRIPIAFPSPDIGSLSGLSWSGIPIRLRLFVDASGRCVDVQFLRASEDADTLDRLRRMFLATRFIPARRAGVDVDAYRDIELDVSDVK